jgi:dGTPase
MDDSFTFSSEELTYLYSLDAEYESLLSDNATKDCQAIRKNETSYFDPVRNNYAIDIDRIIHSAFYNRNSDKTQVFSFFRNDDITRRSSHVQLVSRIARIIGKALKLNLDLIEAIAIGHDVGHTPFGHKGEEFLNELFYKNTGRYFIHNVHSVRVLNDISDAKLTLQTLDGILCHNGEKAFTEYRPAKLSSFEEFDRIIERCYTEHEFVKSLRPSTLEGCVVRISDIIAYLGKDRQDAKKIKLSVNNYTGHMIGTRNKDIITNIVYNVIKRSIGKDYISMDKDVHDDIEAMRQENNDMIYKHSEIVEIYYDAVKPMMGRLYSVFKDDFTFRKYESPLFKHYLDNPAVQEFYQPKANSLRFNKSPDEIVTDYIASMTDDYFVDVFRYKFPNNPLSKSIRYINYFDERYMNGRGGSQSDRNDAK